jgi:hypothetical protein
MRRNLIVLASALAAFAIVSTSAWAVKRPMGFMTSERLKQACNGAGGTFHQYGDGDYTCGKACKDKAGQAASCHVNCSAKSKSCEGDTPDRTSGSVKDILNNRYSSARNPNQMIKNSDGRSFVQQPKAPGLGTSKNSGTYVQPASINSGTVAQPRSPGLTPVTGVPSVSMPGSSPSQGTLNLKKR